MANPEDMQTVGESAPLNVGGTENFVPGVTDRNVGGTENFIPGVTDRVVFNPEVTDRVVSGGEEFVPGITDRNVGGGEEFVPGVTDRNNPTNSLNQSDAETARLTRQSKDAAKVEAKPSGQPQIAVDNPLHQFDSYTYGLSLYMLSVDNYASMIAATDNFNPPANSLLIASAGRGSANRNPHFNTEFYFENLEMTTIISDTPENKNTNLIEGNFRLIEPLGFTFINRLIKAAASVTNPTSSPRYEQQCYLLKIEFFGIKDGEVKKTPAEVTDPKNNNQVGTTKYLPVMIVNLKAEVTERGSVYTIEFVPYSHQALLDKNLTIQTGFLVSGSTVGEILGFGSNKNNPIYTVKNGVNNYYKLLAEKKTNASDYNIINFEIDAEIAAAKIFPSGKGSIRSSSILQQKDANNWMVQPGQRLDSLIEHIIMNSNFITSQIGNKDRAKEVLKTFKILPKIKHKGYDEVLNSNIYETTYVIKQHEKTTKQPAAIKPKPPGQVKIYNYMFTGKNIDIIDFKIDFNVLYFQTIPAYQNEGAVSQGEAATSGAEQKSVAAENNAKQPARPVIKGNLAAAQNVPVASAPNKSGVGGSESNKRDIAAHVAIDLLNDPKSGDLVNLDLRIIGDPLFIKQDDLFYPPSLEDDSTQFLTKNGSYIMDRGELFVLVKFQTPEDYDETTGLTNLKDNDYGYSEFSGFYKVITVKNSFENGKFEQTLSLVRVWFDEEFLKETEKAEKQYEADRQKLELAIPDHKFIAPAKIQEAFGQLSVLESKVAGGGNLLKALSSGAIGGAAIGSLIDGKAGALKGALVGSGLGALTNGENPLSAIGDSVTGAVSDLSQKLSLDRLTQGVGYSNPIENEDSPISSGGLVDSDGNPVLSSDGTQIRTGG